MNRTFAADGPVSADIRMPTGSCVVTAGQNPDITVQVEPAKPGRAADERAVEGTTVEFDRGHLAVVVPQTRGVRLSGFLTGTVIVTVGIPSGSALAVDTSSGSLEVAGTLASLGVEISSGSVSAEEVTVETSVDSSSGKVEIGRIGGQAEIKTSSGSVRVGEVEGRFQCECSSGKALIGSADGEIRLKTSSGRIEVGSAGPGSIRAEASSGSIAVGVRPGVGVDTDLNSDSGRIRGALAAGARPEDGGGMLSLEATTSSGGIEVTRA